MVSRFATESNRLTALKTVSARIRGSKSDLEELGEDTSELAEGFSKYAKEIKGLTGFDIMADEATGSFKDLYDIMEGISKVWDNLSDTQQARVSEILGGTRQLQVVSSIITNWSDAAGAYSAAMTSAGTATKANDIYMETAQAHINQLKSTFQELSTVLMSSDLVSWFANLAKGLLSFVTAAQKLRLLLPAILSSIVAIKALRMVPSILRSKSAVDTLVASLIKEKTVNTVLSTSVANLNLKERRLLASKIKTAMASGQLSAEEGKQILTTLGLATSEGALIVANEGLASSFKSVMASIPIFGWIALGISVILDIIIGITSAVDNTSESVDELNNTFEQTSSEIKTISDNYKSLKKESENTFDRFTELASGVDAFGNNIRLTNDEYSEFWELNNKIAEMFPSINKGLDSNGNAILGVSLAFDTLKGSLEELLEIQRQVANQQIAYKMTDLVKAANYTQDVYQ